MTRIQVGALNLAILLFFAPVSAVGQLVEAEVDEVDAAIQQAKARNLHLVSPRHCERASEKLSEAKERYEDGGNIDDIRERLDEALKELGKAEALEEVGRVLMDEALVARGDALEANSPEFAPVEWENAKEALYNAGREVENGDQDDARNNAAKATELFREAELQAIRKDLLGKAHQLRKEALAVAADERAPVTFREADSSLRQAEEVLKSDRYQRAEARSLAHAAGEGLQHATSIAGTQREIEDGKKGAVERLILEHEQSLAEVAESIGAESNFSAGWSAASERVIAAATSLAKDRDNLQRELLETGERVAELDARLAAFEAREGELDAELQARKKREEAIAGIRIMLTPAEAKVLEGEGELIIRLHGMGFPVASSEIQPSDFPLLTKLQRSLRAFPGAPVMIEGHTDAQGDEDYNQALSQRRAEAVSAYLAANMAGEEGRLSSIGFGESRPIVSNETQEGRAKNRRIDVRIGISEVAGG